MPRSLLLFLAALVLSTPLAHAQSAALTTALDHLAASRTSLGLTEADLGAVAVTDEYTSAHNGVTHLYLRQTVGGIEVYNGRLSAHVTPTERVVGVHSTFVADAARHVTSSTPSLTAQAAAEAAASALGLTVTGSLATIEAPDARHRSVLADGGISLEPIPVQLVYFATEDGTLRLAYDLSIYQRDAQHWWSVRVDAETGALLDQNDWVVQDEWGHGPSEHADLRPLAPQPAASSRATDGTYRVWALPLESPNHGASTLEVKPHDLVASPNGWHDTGSTQYTITRGNNVHAYEDRNDTNTPGYSPDGGEELLFDFEVDFETQTPVEYQDIAITNLFYWNNIIHDVLYAYGFDEAGGNFQANNFGNGGLGNDYVQAEAQDGSGTNNANFGTPPDGARPRMQMYQWEAPPAFFITDPVEIAGSYPTAPATFGPDFSTDPTAFDIIPVEDFVPFYETGAGIGCDVFKNEAEVKGNIALIQRGDCEFGLKVLNAEDAGAIGVIIHNCEPGATGCSTNNPGEGLVTMGPGAVGDQVTIPSAFVQQSTGLLIMDNLPVMGSLTAQINRDSDLDNGVIVHEYGHGVSNRLTGGPQTTSCLNGEEQMGEGWSDYLGLMLTMREGDAAGDPRGIGTYVSFEPVDGPGIRPFPYTTEMGINPSTYATIADPAISVPHGVGSIWANMIWEMTWDLIALEGFDADLINGTGGNNIAMQLVMDGMKLQNCSPGFVDGRDGILMADELTYEGAYYETIWRAFARRGLGFSADQGSSGSRSDGTEAFDLPPDVTPISNEDVSTPGVFALSAAYPNPFSDRAEFTLEVAEAQTVRVAVYDVMGREVARLHDGLLTSGSRHLFALDGTSLASGVYLVRVVGERFAETQRVTMLR